MANTDAIFGLRPLRRLSGGPMTIQRCFVPAADGTALFRGDAVKTSGTADTAGHALTVIQAAAGDAIFGVVVGFEASSGATDLYRAASTARYVYVVTDPDVEFLIQEDADGGAAAITDVGANANLVVGAGSTTTGLSGMELDTSSINTTATLQLKILGYDTEPNNSVAANANLRVIINNHQLKGHTGTAGV